MGADPDEPYQAALVRVPSDHDGMPSGQEVKPAASPYMRLYGDLISYTWYDDNTLPGEEITTGGSWSAGLASDGTAGGTKPIRFYDGSVGGPIQMPAPSGFWQANVGGGVGESDADVKRHLFAISAAYDTTHPDHDEMEDHTVQYGDD